jgi:predicted dehydrogenase
VPEPIRVAVFGNGFARTVVLPCLRVVQGIRLAGISSPNQERLQATAEEFGIETAMTDHRELLERVQPDLVFVTTPPHRHAEMAIDALKAGCHVVCEKPMALNAEESARMVEAARAAKGKLALIDHELRLLPTRVALRQLVEQERLGKLLRADYVLHSPGRRDPSTPWTWWSDREQGGGTLGALGSHAVDALRVLLGEVAEVCGTLSTWTREKRDPTTGAMRPVTADEFVFALVRFQSGVVANLTLSMVETERLHRIRLTGGAGTAHLDEQGPLITHIGPAGTGRGEVMVPAQDDLPPSAQLKIPDTDWARGFLRLARLVIRACAAGERRVPGLATFEDGHRVQLVLDAIRESDREKRWVEVGSGAPGVL